MEAQKYQVFANAGASPTISNFKKKRHDRHARSRCAIQWNGGITYDFLCLTSVCLFMAYDFLLLFFEFLILTSKL